jgi:YegS/Rv2252/BmrU family lipid kinase
MPVLDRPLTVLVNPTAGGGRARAAVAPARAELERLGVDHRVVETTSARHAREEAARAAAAGEAIAGVGGDGLIGSLAGELCGAEVPLVVVPGGRGNDFARVLGISTDPAKAVRQAIEGEERQLDVGECDGRTYVGIASCGFDSEANRIANEARLVSGNLVYLYAAIRALVEWRHARFRVTIDGTVHSFTGYSIGVGNSKAYGGGMYVFPQSVMDDGLLDAGMGLAISKWRFLGRFKKYFDGSHADDPSIVYLRGREFEIESDRPFTVYADGDPIAELPVHIRVAPGVLRVLVPVR